MTLREAAAGDLDSLLHLYLHLHETSLPPEGEGLRQAEEIARRAGCYKIMLMSGAKDEGTLSFYREAGFDSGEKTAFIRRF